MKLDDAYANGAYISGAADFPPRWAKQAQAFRDQLGARAQVGLRYGDSDRQVFDFFHPEGVPRGTFVFVHGGYWRAFDASSWSHLAAGALARGWAVAMPSYDLCPNVRISQITRQVGTALAAIADRTHGPMALAGHSAGGHLVARMMDPLIVPGEVRDRIGHVMPISPLGYLVPLMETSMNQDFQLDAVEAQAESPINMTPPHGAKVTVWVGGDERPAFLEQAEALARAWGAAHVVAEGLHHFDVINPLADPESDMLKVALGVK